MTGADLHMVFEVFLIECHDTHAFFVLSVDFSRSSKINYSILKKKMSKRMGVRLFFAFTNLVYLSFYLENVRCKSDFTEGHQKPLKTLFLGRF